ncbi:MAG: PilN domain-containing protein [Terriglobales bacterium]
MIRINLLGAPKPKKGKRAAVSLSAISSISAGEGLNVLIVSVVLVAIAAGGNGFYYWKLTREAKKIQDDLKRAELDYQRLAQVKIRYQEREKQREAYKKRVDVIDKLRAEQAGPVNLLTTVANTVNSSDEVWLNSMKDQGTTIRLEGVALSVHAVADLMHNLQGTGYFRTVEIDSTYQDPAVTDMQAFVFSLVCAKQVQKPS